MKKSPFRFVALVTTLPIFLGAGCAWQSDLEALQKEVSSLRTDSTLSSKQALDMATEASQNAARAANVARQAVTAAEATNMRVMHELEKPRVFTLNFGMNKSHINYALGRRLDEILGDWRDKAATYQIVGYADMVGSKKFNLALSMKRANKLKAALVRRGVSASMVSVLGVGQNDLAVPTKHGKRLRANRRVVLTIVQKKI
jgi:outer membrane protein OmpA-like peptidoglycan-associated protein